LDFDEIHARSAKVIQVGLHGGIAPHAGWTYSGALAAKTLAALAKTRPLNRVVLLGSDHTGSADVAEMYDIGAWRTPLGDVPVDESLAAAILAQGDLIRSNPAAHAHEHSLEVLVPLLQVLCPEVRIVPIIVAPTPQAVAVGKAIAQALRHEAEPAFLVGSTDLTHHGGHFPAPGGRGLVGVNFSRNNDQRMLRLMEELAAEQIVAEANQHGNACGAGAVAATLAACESLGATRGICLRYTNSYDVIHALYPDDLDDTTVGYASVVFA
jgi:AmmeMemoRadiSam system protein B